MLLILTIQGGSLHGAQFRFEAPKRLTVGRGADCDVRFHPTADRIVSTLHAVFQQEADGLYVIDQNSRNGTFVNGVRVQRARLQSGDVVRLGPQGPQIWIQVKESPMPGAEASSEMTRAAPRQTWTNLGMYDPDREKAPAREGQWFSIGCLILAGSLLTFIAMSLILVELGFVGTLVGGFVAFFPAPFYLMLFLWLDRYDPEPVGALVGAFSWGALVAVVVSLIVNSLFGAVSTALAGPAAGELLMAVVSAPLIEESTKGLGVLAFWLFLKREFDSILDGIVYAGFIALGFATVENVLYYGRSFLQEGLGALVAAVFLRGVLSPFSHALFTAMTGIGCGIARETHRPILRIVMPVVGWAGASFLHALWNLIASLAGAFFFVLYLVVWVPLFLAFLGGIVYLVAREGRIIRRLLTPEVGRLISEAELRVAGSFWGRIRWLLAALGKPQKFRARRRFLRSLTKLAFCYWHVERAQAAGAQTMSLPRIPQLYEEIRRLRDQVGI
ncbi:MAG: PrsW family glutamic-type intramembrane protease [Acidobacteria bacterium]|nr:PrsW family glutamic-type intramembrane protease [Acidobacteriota bacterium]MDW7983772.1 PrsW family glutamic-type intramembrane protease [Acidobacteriota bacterium]